MNSGSGNDLPVSKLIHLCFSIPLNRFTPAIAKIRKKNSNTMIVCFKKGSDARTDYTRILSPLILVIALRGLSTLKALKLDNERPSSSSSPITTVSSSTPVIDSINGYAIVT